MYTKYIYKYNRSLPVYFTDIFFVLLPATPAVGFTLTYQTPFTADVAAKKPQACESCFMKGKPIIESIFFHPFALNDLNQSVLEPDSLCILDIFQSNLQLGVPMEVFRPPCRSRRVVS